VGSLLVVGLGNPGPEYAGTRHNAGFMVVNELCRRSGVRLGPGKGGFWYASAGHGDNAMVLLAPVTYMNRSGEAVSEALTLFGRSREDLVVIVDDFALPLGMLRLRPGGSDGGHNGLASIVYALQTDQFARIRCGIRQEVAPLKEMAAAFVLSPFDAGEMAIVESMIGRAADAVQEIQRSGLERAMGLFNVTPSAPAP
jgi:peptidyl-tRNA hydrolase, PTH1 family